MATTKARVVLGKRPETISRTVTAPLPEGGDAMLEITYRYRTRSEYAALLDKRIAESRAAEPAAADAEQPATWPTASDVQRQSINATAAHILDIATGWGLPEPFDLQHVTQLCDEFPGMATAIVEDYRAAINEGRRGN